MSESANGGVNAEVEPKLQSTRQARDIGLDVTWFNFCTGVRESYASIVPFLLEAHQHTVGPHVVSANCIPLIYSPFGCDFNAIEHKFVFGYLIGSAT